jgi:hypothetical protein
MATRKPSMLINSRRADVYISDFETIGGPMKKIILAVVIFLTTVSLAGAADSPCISSGLQTSSGTIQNTTKGGTLCGVQALTNGTNTATCTVYDNDSAASGNVVGVGITIGAAYSGGSALPTVFYKGLFLSISGTGATCIVYYKNQGM